MALFPQKRRFWYSEMPRFPYHWHVIWGSLAHQNHSFWAKSAKRDPVFFLKSEEFLWISDFSFFLIFWVHFFFDLAMV